MSLVKDHGVLVLGDSENELDQSKSNLSEADEFEAFQKRRLFPSQKIDHRNLPRINIENNLPNHATRHIEIPMFRDDDEESEKISHQNAEMEVFQKNTNLVTHSKKSEIFDKSARILTLYYKLNHHKTIEINEKNFVEIIEELTAEYERNNAFQQEESKNIKLSQQLCVIEKQEISNLKQLDHTIKQQNFEKSLTLQKPFLLESNEQNAGYLPVDRKHLINWYRDVFLNIKGKLKDKKTKKDKKMQELNELVNVALDLFIN